MKNAPKPAPRDRWTINTLLVSCALLLLAFLAVWAFLQYGDRQRRSSSYTSLKPVAVSQGGQSIGATFAVKTSDADVRWAVQNRKAIELALQETLLRIEARRVLAPNGLRELQAGLHDAVNGALGTDKVQEVVVTDFLVSAGN